MGPTERARGKKIRGKREKEEFYRGFYCGVENDAYVVQHLGMILLLSINMAILFDLCTCLSVGSKTNELTLKKKKNLCSLSNFRASDKGHNQRTFSCSPPFRSK